MVGNQDTTLGQLTNIAFTIKTDVQVLKERTRTIESQWLR